MIRIDLQYLRQLLITYALAVFALFLPAVQGKNQAPGAKAIQDRTQADMTLIGHLAESPQLMNIDYLECYLGPKDSLLKTGLAQRHRTSAPAINTLWRDASGRHVAYQLVTSMQSRSDYMAEFNALIPESMHRRLKEMNKILNLSAKPSYDEQGKPIDIYESRPDTKVLIYQAPGLADLNKIRVIYAGNMLPPPSAADMQQAMQYRRDSAIAHQKVGNHEQAATLLKEHLRSNPDDAEAHLKLAESYKAQCRVNEAISEYRTALNSSGSDNDLRKRCIEGLHSLKIDLPAECVNTINGTTAGTTARIPLPVQAPVNLSAPASPAIIKNSKPAGNLDVGF
jgi:tetratricopeptide (TPR) repeat protein